MAFNKRLEKARLNITDDYTLFLKYNEPSYFYETLLVESLVYLAVKNSYDQQKEPPVCKAFIRDEVTINLD